MYTKEQLCNLSDLGDATDYVLEAIQWPEL